MSMGIDLILHHGALTVLDANQDEWILLYRYPAGDVDTFAWPLATGFRSEATQLEQMSAALFDLREMGVIERGILKAKLPDGRYLDF